MPLETIDQRDCNTAFRPFSPHPSSSGRAPHSEEKHLPRSASPRFSHHKGLQWQSCLASLNLARIGFSERNGLLPHKCQSLFFLQRLSSSRPGGPPRPSRSRFMDRRSLSFFLLHLFFFLRLSPLQTPVPVGSSLRCGPFAWPGTAFPKEPSVRGSFLFVSAR